MKALYRTAVSVLICSAFFQACTEDPHPVEYSAPQVSFPMPSDNITATVGEKVTFNAEVTSGDKVTVAWYIDGKIASSAQVFDYVFEQAGTYTVTFEARNGAGTVSHEYTVIVGDTLSIRLSVGDSTRVTRLQLDVLQLAAIVEYGSDVMHEWSVDGELLGEEAFFGTYVMEESRDYEISYRGYNGSGYFSRTFTVFADERPLQISFSNNEETIPINAGQLVNITATTLFGGTGLQEQWYVDDVFSTSGPTFSQRFNAGEYVISYEAVNAKGETVSRSWKVVAISTIVLFDDFEYDAIGGWFNLGENQPGIQLVDNPAKDELNSSDKCLRDMVYGTGGTSGYFNMKAPQMLSLKGFDVSEYSGIRFKVHLGYNKYYPRIDFGGTKYAPVSAPKFANKWEILEYKLPEGKTFDNTKNITFRMMLQENGNNISGGKWDTDTPESVPNRTVYIDDIEFFK